MYLFNWDLICNLEVAKFGIQILVSPWNLTFFGSIDMRGGHSAGIILCMHPANGRRRYNLTSSLTGWAHRQNDPCHWHRLTEMRALVRNHIHCFVWNVIVQRRFNTLTPRQIGRQFANDIFRCIFVNENCFILIWISLKICSQWSDEHYSSIGSNSGLVPNSRQAITWTNDVLGYWRIHASLGLIELTHWGRVTDVCVR